ncbi:hypothetical protein GCM10027429_07100 [Marivirga atlantica]|jgi:hypothetical protein|uniref:Sulfotransferase domain-containing protein n=1 Tax=Marivirga atlantica TaxID=1548457 RepID=A0A937A664_9BACT|nr:hypothetical protein [Marivirga atlantica]MBL0764320.1 hypothetical protein [Marivirga atlantica]
MRLTKIRNSAACFIAPYLKSFDPKKALIVSSDPRGGSTWLAETLFQIGGLSMIWEPLHIGKVKELNDLGFGYPQIIPEHVSNERLYYFFESLFSGKLINMHLLQYSGIRSHYISNQLLFKFCRAGALLNWLINNFEFENKPIHLVRHPCAVIASQIKHGAWSDVDSQYVIPDLYSNSYIPYQHIINRIKTVEENLAFKWCINNHDLINNDKIELVYFEDLFVNTEEVLKKLLKQWQTDINSEIIKRSQSLSFTTKKTETDKIASQLDKWKYELSTDQIDNIMSILHQFNIKIYSADNVMPSNI